MPRVRLRPGCHLAVTWGIADRYGGMTAALLHRSRAFVRLGGAEVEVVTFDLRPDYPAVEARLRSSGELIDGMRLLNLWDWLRGQDPPNDPDAASAAAAAPFTPLGVDPAFVSEERDGREMMRIRLTEDGSSQLQVDHYRADGSLAVSDRRDVRERGTPGGRSIVWCDGHGRPVRRWKSARSLYRWWLDRLRANRPTTLIVDSKTSARLLLGYRRTQLLTFHVVHGSHRHSPGSPDVVRASRAEVFASPGGFDSMVFLTARQRTDARRILGPHAATAVIPNGRDAPGGTIDRVAPARAPGAGIVLASLEKRKRVDHAVKAVTAVDGAVTLDIFGEGPERPVVERAAGSTPGIRLHGYRADASAELARASFLLLTSRSEGFPLVLVESMAHGCLPVAYDVPYGPADIIRHGHNGFLVPHGNVAALTATLEELLRMPPERIAALRRNAVRTAARFSDDAVTARWAAEIDRVAMARGMAPAAPVRAFAFRVRRGAHRRWRRW